MSEPLRIVPLAELPADVEELRFEAVEEGFGFVEKLVAEWRSGANRFARPGEVLLAAFRAHALVAVGGLNRDPYTAGSGVGRLRHLHVRRSARRTGVGRALVRQLVGRAEGTFRSIRLRTTTQDGAEFYARLGFHAVQSETATHAWSPGAPGSAVVEPTPENGGRGRPAASSDGGDVPHPMTGPLTSDRSGRGGRSRRPHDPAQRERISCPPGPESDRVG